MCSCDYTTSPLLSMQNGEPWQLTFLENSHFSAVSHELSEAIVTYLPRHVNL